MGEKFPAIPLKSGGPTEYEASMEARASAWMTRAKHGESEAFDELTLALRTRAFRLARSWVGSHEDALELSQEAFLKTYRARDTYREDAPFLPWFHRILRNTCFSFLRSRKRLRARSLTSQQDDGESDWEIESDDPGPAEGVHTEERVSVFWQGFERLSVREREILGLRHFQELSYAQIACELEIPEGTVMSRLFHARRRLREALAGYFDDENRSAEAADEKKPRKTVKQNKKKTREVEG